MEKNPEISVIITAYNKGKYIGKTIQSVLNQTLQDFEIIIIDDGSTDNTREIISNFSDHRIKYYFQENSGLPACARNKGMSLARGKYIAILDGDDFWEPDKLNRCKKVLDADPDVGLVCHNEAVIYNDKIVNFTNWGPYKKKMFVKLLLEGNCVPTSSVVIRSKIFFDDQLKFSEEPIHATIEDYEYWLRLSQKYHFFLISDILGYYRVTDTSSDQLNNPDMNAKNMLTLLDSHFCKLNHSDRIMLKRMKRRRSAIMSASARMFLHKNNFKKSREWYSKALAEYPFSYKAILGIIISLLKIRVIYR